jgi:hypothetical protein
MDADQFYVTLPSSASMDIYPENTLASFKVKLPFPLDLTSELYEVALSELIMDTYIYSLSARERQIKITRQYPQVVRTPETLNSARNKKLGREYKYEVITIPKKTYKTTADLVAMWAKFLRYSKINVDIQLKLFPDGLRVKSDKYDIGRDDQAVRLSGELIDELFDVVNPIPQGDPRVAFYNYKPNKSEDRELNYTSDQLRLKIVRTNQNLTTSGDDSGNLPEQNTHEVITIPKGEYKTVDSMFSMWDEFLRKSKFNKDLQFTLMHDGIYLSSSKHEISLPENSVEIAGPLINQMFDVENPLPQIDPKVLFYKKREREFTIRTPKVAFIYTDIVQHQIVGDTQAQLLRITDLPIAQDKGYGSTSYSELQYLPLLKGYIETIQVHIKTVAGDMFPFTNGTFIVKLHFRKITQ